MHLIRMAAALVGLVGLVGAADAEPVKIRIGWSNMPHHMIPVLYSKPEILKHYGKTYIVEPINFRGSSPQLQALAAKEIDLSVSSPPVLALAVTNARLDLKVLADVVQDGIPGYHSETILVRKDSGIKTVQDVKGKRLGTSAIGSSTDTAMRIFFQKNGLIDKKDYTTVEASFANIPIMLDEKKLDLGPVIQPYLATRLASGDYEVLFRQSDGVGPSQVVFLVGRTEFLEANRAAMMDFFEDHVRAMRWFTDPKNRTEALGIVANFMKVPPENLSHMFTEKDYYRDPFLFPNIANLQTGINLPFEYKIIPARIDVAPKYVDLSFVEEAKRRIEAAK